MKTAQSNYSQKGFSSVVGVVIAFVLLLGGVFVYSVSKSPDIQKQLEVQRSLKNVGQDVPKGNPHWDKSQELFAQMKKEQDAEKIRKLTDQAIAELKKVLEEQPRNARVWYELGNAHTWISSLDSDTAFNEGLAAYKKAEELDPKSIVYINGTGDLLITMGKYDEAIIQFQKTLRLTSDSGYANQSLCKAYIGTKVYDSAKESCQKALDIFTKHNTDGSYDSQILETKKVMSSIPK